MANVDIPGDQPISQLKSPVAETYDISILPQQPPSLSTSPTLIPNEELEAYFRAPITQPPHGSPSPAHHHLKIIKEGLQRPFPLDPAFSASLERSLLKVSRALDDDIPASLKQVCTNIPLIISDAMSDYNRFKAHRDDSLKALEELASLKAQKHTFLTEYQTVKSS